ncbi:MAG TPA: DksA/TraR family C4-type zinc finger protein [Halomonas sp.]|nr:DksA/TraR family C4-type zinc finger protein [Halomonas sp.]
MAGGWSKDGDVQQQIDDSISDELERARRELPQGESAHFCQECDEPIPEARRQAVPGVQLCLSCQAERDRQQVNRGFNRRGSKDSQLR